MKINEIEMISIESSLVRTGSIGGYEPKTDRGRLYAESPDNQFDALDKFVAE